MAKRTTGQPTEYSDHDEAALEAAIDDAWADYEGELAGLEPSGPAAPGGTPAGPSGGGLGDGGSRVERRRPGRLRVTADIEWAGTMNATPRRTTTLAGLDLAALAPFVNEARKAREKASDAQPLRSYRAKGWHAQLRALTATQRGQHAAMLAGLAPTRRTLTNWLTEDTAPRKRDRERIARAYESLRERPVTEARTSQQQANHELAQKLNAVVSDTYGADVRFLGDVDIEILD